MIIIICIISIWLVDLVVLILLCYDAISRNRNQNLKKEIELNKSSSVDYYETIEKTYLSILEEKENEEPYKITLWWGLDGCRLNDAGEVEWIRRKKNQISALKSGFHNVSFNYGPYTNTGYFQSPYLNYPYLYNGCNIQNMTSVLNSGIQSQLNQIQFQQDQMIQNYNLQTGIRLGRDIYGRIIERP